MMKINGLILILKTMKMNESRLKDIKRQTPGKVLKKTKIEARLAARELETDKNQEMQEPWQCSVCNIKFSKEDDLKEHSGEHRHDEIVEDYICSNCSKKFSDAVKCLEHCSSCFCLFVYSHKSYM